MIEVSARTFLTARWLQLAMINYEVDRRVLDALVPYGTQLDLWGGRCFVSVVGFQFADTRVLGCAIPFHCNFEEVNLRFYVKRIVDGEIRRGVVFIKEIVPRRAIAWVANALYNENYVALPMSHDDAAAGDRRDGVIPMATPRRMVPTRGDARRRATASRRDLGRDLHHGTLLGLCGATRRVGAGVSGRAPALEGLEGHAAQLVCDVGALYGSSFVPLLKAPPVRLRRGRLGGRRSTRAGREVDSARIRSRSQGTKMKHVAVRSPSRPRPRRLHQSSQYDVVIRHGTIYDGTGAAGKAGDVAILDDRIAAVGDLGGERGRERGRCDRPRRGAGLHQHAQPLRDVADRGRPRRRATSRQGVTLEVFGESSMGPITEQMKKDADGAPGRHQVQHRLEHARRLPGSSRGARDLDQRRVVCQRGDRPRQRSRPRQPSRRRPRSSSGCARTSASRWTRARWA